MTIAEANEYLTTAYQGESGIVSFGCAKDCIMVYVDKAANTPDQRELLSEIREAIAPIELKVSFSSLAS